MSTRHTLNYLLLRVQTGLVARLWLHAPRIRDPKPSFLRGSVIWKQLVEWVTATKVCESKRGREMAGGVACAAGGEFYRVSVSCCHERRRRSITKCAWQPFLTYFLIKLLHKLGTAFSWYMFYSFFVWMVSAWTSRVNINLIWIIIQETPLRF